MLLSAELCSALLLNATELSDIALRTGRFRCIVIISLEKPLSLVSLNTTGFRPTFPDFIGLEACFGKAVWFLSGVDVGGAFCFGFVTVVAVDSAPIISSNMSDLILRRHLDRTLGLQAFLSGGWITETLGEAGFDSLAPTLSSGLAELWPVALTSLRFELTVSWLITLFSLESSSWLNNDWRLLFRITVSNSLSGLSLSSSNRDWVVCVSALFSSRSTGVPDSSAVAGSCLFGVLDLEEAVNAGSVRICERS